MTNVKDSQEQMFIYHQTILEKVSFSPELFSHELSKALQNLSPEQGEELIHWIRMRFGYQGLPCRVSR